MGNTSTLQETAIRTKGKIIDTIQSTIHSGEKFEEYSVCMEDAEGNIHLAAKDYEFLQEQSNLSKEEIKSLFEQFMKNHPSGLLDKDEFLSLYSSLRDEDSEKLNEISKYVFKAFDKDDNGYIAFDEFLIAYALTIKGDLKSRLTLAFDVYDLNKNGSLDVNEVETVIHGMLNLLGYDKNHRNTKEVATQCMEKLDANKDLRISKDEFINGLLENEQLRKMMCPFN